MRLRAYHVRSIQPHPGTHAVRQGVKNMHKFSDSNYYVVSLPQACSTRGSLPRGQGCQCCRWAGGTGRLLSHANDSSTSNCTAGKLLRGSAQSTAPSRGGSKERVGGSLMVHHATAQGTVDRCWYRPFGPSFLRTWPAVLPDSLFSTDTTESAGWDTMAQNTPAAEEEHASENWTNFIGPDDLVLWVCS